MNIQHGSHDSRDRLGRSVSMRPTPTDLLSTISDAEGKKLLQNFLAIRSGINVTGSKVADLAKNSDLNFGSIYDFFAKRHAISVSDLPEIVDGVIKRLPVVQQTATHRKIVRFEKAKDFLPHSVLLSIDDLHVSIVHENGEVPMTALNGLLVKGVIQTRRVRVMLSRQALLSGQVTLADLPMLLLNASMRDEAANTYAVLEANANLPDELPLFGADNTATGANLYDIGAALTKFRDQKAAINSDEYAYLEPKYFICPTAHEISAHKELFAAGLTNIIEIIASPGVSSSYLLGDPKQAPVLVRLALSEDPIIETRPGKFNDDAAIAVDLLHDYTILVCNRVGAVKLTVAT